MKKPKFTTYRQLKRELLSDPKVKKAYDALETEYQIASQMIEARIKQKMSQEELARRAKTGQAVISRLEGMNARPSISLLSRVAKALNTKIRITVS